MFGLLGLLGAVMAGFLVDALTTPAADHTTDDDVSSAHDAVADAGLGDLLDDPGAENDPAAGMPVSSDLPDPTYPDEALQGGDNNDVLAAHGGDDSLAGAGGDDQMGGRDGADVLDGGDGADWLYGGTGADSLAGAGGADQLHGDDGADHLAGDDGNDSLSGDGGRDALRGGAGDDSLIGGQGADTMQGDAGDDVLQGGSGADQLFGGAGADILDGNDGNDTIWGDAAGLDDIAGPIPDGMAPVAASPLQTDGTDFLNGGAGDDALHFSAGDFASGGDGADQFMVSDIAPGDPVARIMDFNREEDALVLLYDPSHHATPEVTVSSEAGSPDATVMIDGVPVAQVMGGAGLQAQDVVLQAA